MPVVRRYSTFPMNLNHLAPLAVCIAVLAIFGGTALSRRLHWPLLLPALLFLGLGMGAFVAVWLLAGSYFQLNNDQAIPWIENLGIGLGVFSGICGATCIYFFCAACFVAVRRALQARTKSQHTL